METQEAVKLTCRQNVGGFGQTPIFKDGQHVSTYELSVVIAGKIEFSGKLFVMTELIDKEVVEEYVKKDQGMTVRQIVELTHG